MKLLLIMAVSAALAGGCAMIAPVEGERIVFNAEHKRLVAAEQAYASCPQGSVPRVATMRRLAGVLTPENQQWTVFCERG